jgi:hypothetical protein
VVLCVMVVEIDMKKAYKEQSRSKARDLDLRAANPCCIRLPKNQLGKDKTREPTQGLSSHVDGPVSPYNVLRV